ncbi:hypothetical protein KDA11_06465, partial [Candidatus Saccharibacteria bacterium]|nr:hypothetical protein [Candidatus Saccharibacteria bacterium]
MNKLYSFLLILTGMLAVQLAAPSNVGATVNLNPNPGSSIPYVQHNLLSNCDTLFKTSPAYAYFFTYAGNSSVDIGSFEVGPSNPSVNIRMNWASSVCKPNSAVNLTTLQAVPTTPGVFGLAPGMAHDHTSTAGAGNYNIPGTYRHSFGEFSYSPPGGFTASGSYTVNIDLYRISRFQSGTILCVNAGSRNPANVLDFSACGKLTLTATFWVNVHNNPAPSLNVVSTCTGIDVATSGTRADIYGPSGGLGNVIGKSGSFKLEGLVSAGTTVDVYGIGDGSTTFGNTHAAHTWIPPSDCRSNFSIRPTASVNLNDTENPTSANFFSVARLDSGPASVNNVSVRHYYFVIKDGLEVSLSDNSTTESITPSGATYRQDGVNVSILGLKAGDQVCSSVYVNPGGGVAKLDGTIISKNPEEVSDKQCQTIVNKPFIS